MTLSRRDISATLLMAAAYYVSGRLGLLLAVPPGYATAVWPPSGIALAGMLAYGQRVLPGIWLGSLLLNVNTALDFSSVPDLLASLFVPVAVANGAVLQAWLGQILIRRFVGYTNILTMELDVLRLLLLGGPIACLVSSTLGTAALVVTGSIAPDAVLFSWWTWWVGDSIGVLVFTPVMLVWTAQSSRDLLRRQLTMTLPLLATFALVVGVFAAVNAREQARERAEFETRADELAGRMQSHLDRYTVALHAVGGLFSSSADVTPTEFSDFATSIMPELPGLFGLHWNAMVTRNERQDFEARMVARGIPGFRILELDASGRLMPAGDRDFYAPVTYSAYSVPAPGAQGFDMAAEPARREAMQLALQRRQEAASHSVVVVSAPHGDRGLLVFLPVFRSGQLQGFASLVVLVDDVISRSVPSGAITGSEVRLVDVTDAAPVLLSGPPIQAEPPRGSLRCTLPIHLAQRQWQLEFTLPDIYLVAHHSWQAWIVLAAGMILTALLGTLLLVVVGRSARVEDLVTQRTAQLRDTQEQARRARDEAVQASRAKSEFVANMSHEIRTPMNGIIGMTDALRDTPLTARQQEIAEAIRFSADSLLTIVNDILDFSKIEAGMLSIDFVEVDLGQDIERVVAVLTERIQRKGLEIVLFLDPRLPRGLRADQIRLNQVLTNLTSNAVKFTERGEIEIRATLQEETADHAVVRISVRDTGIGIPPQVQQRLFQPFTQADGSTTRRYGGTGLGLVISKQLVELMGGEIGVDSKQGEGSTFWFTVRLMKTGAALPLETPPQLLSGRRALVVDDNATARRSLVQRLTAWGMVAGEAADAASAMREAQRAAQQGMPYEVAIVDQRMPDIDGVELSRRLRSLAAGAISSVVLLQSLRGSNDPAVLRAAGVDALLTKPVGQSDLHDSLTTLIAGQRQLAAERPMQTSTQPSPARPWHVLVAEDNPINQMVARHQLQRLGLKPEFVVNGREAVEATQRAAYDLILMDCQMPELDGYSATAQIRRSEGSARHTWIVAMTAHAMAGDRERCMAAGMDDYIAKPMDPKLLAAALERFERRNAEPAATPAPAAAVNGQAPPVNLARLWDAANGDAQFVRELADLYIEQTTEQLGFLREAVAKRSAQDIERVAHRCKGGSGSCGVTGLAALFQDLERRGREEQLENVDQALADIEREYARVQEFLEQPLPMPDTVQ